MNLPGIEDNRQWQRLLDAIAKMLAEVRIAEMQSEVTGDIDHDSMHSLPAIELSDR